MEVVVTETETTSAKPCRRLRPMNGLMVIADDANPTPTSKDTIAGAIGENEGEGVDVSEIDGDAPCDSDDVCEYEDEEDRDGLADTERECRPERLELKD